MLVAMAELPRRWILALGLACSAPAAASSPAVPTIDLVAEVHQREAMGNRVGDRVTSFCGPTPPADDLRRMMGESLVNFRIDEPESTADSRDDVWDPCLRSSCTIFSGDVTR